MGNALIGRMLSAALRIEVDIMMKTETVALDAGHGAVNDLTQRKNGNKRRVVLATGGFPPAFEDAAGEVASSDAGFSPSAPGHTGALHDLAFGLGAYHREDVAQPCFWAPCSHRRHKDGSMAVFPHFVFDRSKPGIISVGRDGRRFVNEATSYHLFGAAQFAANRDGWHVPAYQSWRLRRTSHANIGFAVHTRGKYRSRRSDCRTNPTVINSERDTQKLAP